MKKVKNCRCFIHSTVFLFLVVLNYALVDCSGNQRLRLTEPYFLIQLSGGNIL